jgi:hypothetical protein
VCDGTVAACGATASPVYRDSALEEMLLACCVTGAPVNADCVLGEAAA